MNLRDLAYISAVARLGQFGRAAEACHVSQPALSSQIKKLENELGITLFERDNRSVRLTEAGRDIVHLADEALTIIDSIRTTAASARAPYAGEFRLGSIPTITPYLLPHFVSQSRNALPELSMLFHEDITERLTQSLIDGDIDAALLATVPEHPKLEIIDLYDEPFWIVFPHGHVLGQLETISSTDLPCNELLLLSEGHCFREQALDVFQLSSAGTMPIRATSLETLVNMVMAGQGVTLVPAMALNSGWAQSTSIHAMPLDDPRAYRRITLVYRKRYPRRHLIERIAELIREHLPASVHPLPASR